MDVKETLKEMGLSEGESTVYLGLLKLGSSPVNKIKEETGLHRTTIYDFVEKLLNKGLVNYVTKNKTRHYKATNPSKLRDFIEEKRRNVEVIMPHLERLSSLSKEEISVEVYRGKEGIKKFFNDRIRIGGDLLCFGIDDSIWKKRFPILLEQYVKELERKKLNDWMLASATPTYLYKSPTAHYKFIPQEYFDPTPIMVYENKVVIVIWEPLSVIIIDSKQLATAYKKHFNMLWKMARKKFIYKKK